MREFLYIPLYYDESFVEMNFIFDKLRRKVFSRFYFNANYDTKNSVLIAGTGRGGTTWLADIINYNNEYRFIFEPFHPEKVPEASNFLYKQYLRPNLKCRVYYDSARAILSGGVRNKWVDSLNKKFFCNKRLIKDIRINLVLKWIHVNFPEIPIILILRHPCAIAYSKMKRNWESNLHWYLNQKMLVENFLSPFKEKLMEATDEFEKHIYLWCIETYVPLRQFFEGEIHVIFYEDLCVEPKAEIERLFAFLSKKVSEDVFLRLSIPSAMSREDSAIVTGADLVGAWKQQLTPVQLNRALEILACFKLDRLYQDGPLPLVRPELVLPDSNSVHKTSG